MKEKKALPKEEDPKIKLYRIKITDEVEATSIEDARKQATELFGLIVKDKKRIEESVERVTRAKYSSRADRLSEARSMLEEAQSIVDELKGEIEEWRDNLPENLQGSDKYSALEDCVGNLEEVESAIEEAVSNCDNVEFPGMY